MAARLPHHVFPAENQLELFQPQVAYGAEMAARFPNVPIGEAQPPPSIVRGGLYEESHVFQFGDVAYTIAPVGKKWSAKAYYVVECTKFVRKGKLNRKVLPPGEEINKIVYLVIQGGNNNQNNHAVMLEPQMLFHYRVLVDEFVKDLSVSYVALRHILYCVKFYL